MLRSNWVAISVITCVIGTLSPRAVRAQNHPCTTAEGRAALDEAVMLRSWDALYHSYTKYRQCDDGAIAEGYSESVARILVDHWSTLPRFAELGDEKPAFRAFVFKHLDATLNTDDLEKIKKNATARCTATLREACKDLTKEVDRALNEP